MERVVDTRMAVDVGRVLMLRLSITDSIVGSFAHGAAAHPAN